MAELSSSKHFDCMVLDLGLHSGDMSGFDLLEKVKSDPENHDLPIIIYTGKELSPEEETRIKKYAETIIVKDVKSPERLLDETALFLHRVEAKLPEQKRKMLEQLHDADAVIAGKRVLIVDDDVRNIFSLTSVLEDHGMIVRFAENGKDALKSLEEDADVDAVLMDVMMPEMDGYETMRRFARRINVQVTADHCAHRQGDEGRQGEVHRGRSLGLHHEAGRYRAAPLTATRVAVQVDETVPSVLADTGTYDQDLERIEIELLLEGIYRHYGFDFRSYAYASIRRRLWKRIEAEGLGTVSALQGVILHQPQMMEKLLLDLSINVTAMFRDPTFYQAFRDRVVPLLRTYPFIRIWHAGCATGEEVYSMAILLEEEGLYERSRIYATDINEVVLQKAKAGIFLSTACRSTRRTTLPPAASAPSPIITRPSTAERCSTRR